MNPLYEEIGRRVRLYRRRRRMTQQQLAEAAGISLSFLGHIERGTRKLSVETLVQLARALECTPDELLGFAFSGGAEPDLPTLLSLAAEALRQRAQS